MRFAVGLAALLAIGVVCVASPASAARVVSGSYTGTALPRSVNVGFSPDVVIVKGNTAQGAVIKTRTMAGSYSKFIESGGPSGGIGTLGTSGFSLGQLGAVNALLSSYTYVAIQAYTGEVVTDSYVGDGNPGRTVTGVGFSPAYVMVLSQNGNNGVQRFAIEPLNESLMIGLPAKDVPRITNMAPDGFQVSSDAEVNAAGVTYHYVAFAPVVGGIAIGSYTGDGTASHVLAAPPFRSDYMVVRAANPAGATVHRATANGDNVAMRFDAKLNVSNAIRRFLPSGFEVGNRAEVNTPAATYYWLSLHNALLDADAAVSILSNRTIASLGNAVTIKVKVNNAGVRDITGLNVTSLLPAGLVYVIHTPSRGLYNPLSGLWTVGNLDIGETAELTINAIVNVLGPASLGASALVSGMNQTDGNASNNTATLPVQVITQEFRVASGTYTGNGGASRPITGLGFTPDVVLVAGENGAGSIVRTATMPAGMVKELGTNKILLAGAINTLDADGFTIGSHATANGAGAVYHWTAFQTASGSMKIGTYVGDGLDDRSIAGVGFQPGYVIVMNSDGEECIQRFAAMGGDASARIDHSPVDNDRIQAFEADGFQVGKHGTVNRAGKPVHYIAWKDGAAQATTGIYVGSGANDTNGDVGFRPVALFVRRGSDGQPTVARTASMSKTVPLSQDPTRLTAITGLTGTGFTVGNDPAVNQTSVLYYWTAFRDSRSTNASISVTTTDATPNTGDTVTLGVTLTNQGPSDANNFEVMSPLPNGLSFVSASATLGSYDEFAGKWSIGTLTSGASVTLSIQAAVQAGTGGTTLTHTATISAVSELDVNNTDDSASQQLFVQAAELAVEVQAQTTLAAAGDTLRLYVGVADNGPNDASGVVADLTLPPLLNYVTHSGDGSFDPGTGTWTVGTVSALGAATMTLLAVAGPGSEGQHLTTAVAITGADQEDPAPANNVDSTSVQVITPLKIVDAAGSLYPASAAVGQPALALRIDVDNPADVGVMLATTSTISFTDGPATYIVGLKNPSYVPAHASGFTLSFGAAAVPPAMSAGSLYDLRLELQGTTDETVAYVDTFLTTGRNAILISEPQLVISANIAGDTSVHPGATTDLLRLEFQSPFTTPRTLDSLIVTNTSYGDGTAAQLDGLVPSLRLYGDSDGDGKPSPPDSLLATASFNGGRAVFDVTWTVGANAVSGLMLYADVDSFVARDGDVIDAAIIFASDLKFLEPTAIAGSISPLDPLDSYGVATVDGMVAFQSAFTDAGVDTLASGQTNVWLSTLVLPTNGDADDVLNAIEIADFSGGFNATDIAALDLVRDDGDSVYTFGVDVPLGRFAFVGDRYALSGLSAPVTAGNRFFLVATAAAAPNDGDTFLPGVPLDGIQMASGNDGPLDASLVTAQTTVFRRADAITVTSRALSALTVNPGRARTPMLWIDVQNNTVGPVSIDSLLLTNASTGAGSVPELDGNFKELRVYSDNGDGIVGVGDALLASSLQFSAGVTTAELQGVSLATGATATLLVTCDVDSFCTADGDLLAVSLEATSDVRTSATAPVTGAFPVVTTPARAVDGMLAHQLFVTATLDTLLTAGSSNNLVFDVAVHGNGYANDLLQSLTVENLGTATEAHIPALTLFADGGNGSFDAGSGDDVPAGILAPIGNNRFRVTGLSWALPGACGQNARFYVAANVAASPPSGASLQLSIPAGGVVVASGNDGPIDAPVVNPAIDLVPKPDELTVFPYSVGDRRVHPGAVNVLNFGAGVYNGFDTPLTLNGARLFQKGSATAGEIVRVRAWADEDTNGLFDPTLDRLLATTTSSDVYYPLSAINLPLPPKRITYLFATCDPSLGARDSVSVNLQLNSESDLTFPGPLFVHGEFPVDSPGEDLIDGMVLAQLGVVNAPSQTVPPGENDVFVLGFVVARNGMLPDVLERITVSNAGTATPGQDIVFLNLWAEGSGNATFEPAGDRLLSSLTWNGSGWQNPSTMVESIPIAGLRCYVSAHVSGTAVDGRTLHAFLPLNGVHVASGNDGPIDDVLLNSGTQVISTDPVIASVSTDRPTYSNGQAIVATMKVRNAGAVTLTGVYPDSLWASGGGSATLAGGPVPAVADVDPGEVVSFTWSFIAASPGDVTYCGSASDSVTTSIVACADPLVIESRPSAVAAAFDDHAPAAVNRGQRSIPVWRLDLSHTDSDTLAAAVRTQTIIVDVTNNAGAPIAPNSVLSGLTLVSSTGTNTAFVLTDSLTSPLHLSLPQAVRIHQGESVSIDAVVDIATGATLAPFRLGISAPSQVGVVDDNDGAAVALSPSPAFPWLSSPVDVDEPATTVLASGDAVGAAAANNGQHGVILWDGTMTNGSPATAASASVTSVVLDFHDGNGNPIAPPATIVRLAILGGGTKLFESIALPSASTAKFDFSSPFLLPPQQSRPFVIEVDIQNAPATSAFGVTIASPASIATRDENSGLALAVQAGGGDSFPLVSRLVSLQQPATGVAAALTSLAPPAILPGNAGVRIARVSLSHADPASSSIVVDSLALVFRTPEGAAFYPGNYFNRIRVIGSADTLATLTNLSSVSSVVECRLAAPLILAPAGSDSLTVSVDAKGTYVPGSFVMRIDRELIHAVDANDPARTIAIAGAFPLQSNPSHMLIPGADVYASAASSIPPNVAGSERSLTVFDFELENRAAAGFTDARLESLTVVIQGRGGSAINAANTVSAARLIESDSLVCAGTINAAGISFALPPGYTLSPGSKRNLKLRVDLAGNLTLGAFRFAVVDATAVALRDVSTSAVVTPRSDAGFPLASAYTHVLGTNEDAFTNYPNPFAAGREATRVTFFLEHPSRVTLRLFTLWGDPVATLVSGKERSAGLQQDVTWDGRNGDGDVVNNGVYYLVLDVAPDSGSPLTLRRKVAVKR